MLEMLQLVYAMTLGPIETSFGYHVSAEVWINDDNGCPIENAQVRIESSARSSGVLFGGNNDYDKSYFQKSGTNGLAIVHFRCPSGNFRCFIEAPGYYGERRLRDGFMIERTLGGASVRLVERKKTLKFVLHKIRNPIDLVIWDNPVKPLNLPLGNGEFGFDLQKNDWIGPFGKGETVDFVVESHCNVNSNKTIGGGALVFTGKDGAYRVPKIESCTFNTVYGANPDSSYTNRLEFSYVGARSGENLVYQYVVTEQECLVIRSRTKVDAEGKILAANYSKIDGPLWIREHFYPRRIVFNPKCNDPNLEEKR